MKAGLEVTKARLEQTIAGLERKLELMVNNGQGRSKRGTVGTEVKLAHARHRLNYVNECLSNLDAEARSGVVQVEPEPEVNPDPETFWERISGHSMRSTLS